MRPKSGTASRLRLATFLVCVLLTAACGSATYIPWNGRGGPAPAAPAVAAVSSVTGDKSNEVGRELGPFQRRRHRPIFRNDADVYRYLKGVGQQLMIWKCRNAIQSHWYYKPLPYIDLYCDVIGTMKTVAWSFHGRKIAGTGVELAATDVSRYRYTIATHYDGGHYYSAWLDFRLRIHNATQQDSGIYRFRVTSPSGDADHRLVYVDISAPPPPAQATPTSSGSGAVPAADPEVGRSGRRKQSGKAERRRRLKNKKKRRQRRRRKLERRRQRRDPSSAATSVDEK